MSACAAGRPCSPSQFVAGVARDAVGGGRGLGIVRVLFGGFGGAEVICFCLKNRKKDLSSNFNGSKVMDKNCT